jgi:hypothetical protein
MEEIQSSPNSDGNSFSSNKLPAEEPGTPTSPNSRSITSKPQNQILLKPLSTDITPVSPPATPRSPRSPLRPSPLRSSSPSPPPQDHPSLACSPLPQLDFRTPSPILPLTAPLTPPTPPEKLRLLKALEIRRQKLAGNKIVKIPKFERPPSPKRSLEEERPTSRTSEDLAQFLEAQRRALEEQRRHIAALEVSEKDLLSGWVNFQASTSLVFPQTTGLM